MSNCNEREFSVTGGDRKGQFQYKRKSRMVKALKFTIKGLSIAGFLYLDLQVVM
jgi:hypothetical protein